MIRKENLLLWASIVCLALFTFSCSNDDETPDIDEPVLVSSSLYFSVSQELSVQYLDLAEIEVPEEMIQYDVNVYKIIYNTDFNGESIEASGLVALPVTADPVGMFNYNHGTITADDDAPSLEPATSPTRFLYGAMASPGLIGVIPDYVGYAGSSTYVHPYFIAEPNSTAITNLMKAAVELAEEKELNFNGDLYIAGYSEGAYNTLATQKAIQEEGLDGFELKSTFLGGGVYEFETNTFLQFIGETFETTFYAFRTYSLLDYYDFSLTLNDFFNEPYASEIPDLFDGSLGFGEISAELPDEVDVIFTNDFLTGFTTDSKFDDFKSREAENGLLNFTPSTKIYFFHSEDDETADYLNSVNARNYFIQQGVAESELEFTTVSNLSHVGAALPWIESIFNNLADEL